MNNGCARYFHVHTRDQLISALHYQSGGGTVKLAILDVISAAEKFDSDPVSLNVLRKSLLREASYYHPKAFETFCKELIARGEYSTSKGARWLL